jgi:phosphonate transport system ATP-binding protein
MIRLEQVSHTYPNGTPALRDIDLEIGAEAFTVLIGPSGAGKSTLMRILNGLVRPTNGRVYVQDLEISRAGAARVRNARRGIGMVFQGFNLVKRLNALENVLCGLLGGIPAWRSTLRVYQPHELEAAFDALERVGMADFAWQRADTLSGGQQQRVGIARALVQRPRLILADEPISALDPKSSEQVMALLRRIQTEDGISVVANLHHLDAVREYAERVVALQRGAVVFDGAPALLTESVTRALYYGDANTVTPLHEPHTPNRELVVQT